MPKLHYDTFLSHNSADKPIVEALAHLLKQEGIVVWLDEWNLIPGNPWQDEIEEALTACATCCILIGSREMGPWQSEEMRVAIARRVSEKDGFRVIPVLLPGNDRPERSKLPSFLAQITWVEFHQRIDEDKNLHRLTCAIRGVAPGPRSGQTVFEGVCPYRGLEVFDVEHAPFFFGRAALTEWLLNEIKPRGAEPANRFLAIIGASGSGKSSLARAGLIAKLKRGALAGSTDWPVIILKPGNDPLETLALKLAKDPNKIGEIREHLLSDPRHLNRSAHFLLRDAPEERRLVILVDQFEEIFSLCREPGLRQAFIDNLLQAANEPFGKTLVLLTLRADFYGKCSAHDDLAASLADHQLLVGPMNRAGLRETIEQPAYATGCELETGLTDLLIQDVQGQPGGLPLLQFALNRLWQIRSGNRLTLSSYHTIEGLNGALEQKANDVYQSLNGQEQTACRRIFLRLTEPGEGTEDTRRRAWLSELGTDKDTTSVLDALTKGRLVTRDEGEGTGCVLEVSHEALIRG